MASCGQNIRTRLGKRIRLLRLRKGWKQDDLAAHCEFSRVYISQLENGRKDIKLSNLETLANALEVELGTMLANL